MESDGHKIDNPAVDVETQLKIKGIESLLFQERNDDRRTHRCTGTASY
jgi:hypothetical protein